MSLSRRFFILFTISVIVPKYIVPSGPDIIGSTEMHSIQTRPKYRAVIVITPTRTSYIYTNKRNRKKPVSRKRLI